MAWEDLVSKGVDLTSPETSARVDLLRQQGVGVNLSNQSTALGLGFMKALAGSTLGGQGEQSGDQGAAPAAAPGQQWNGGAPAAGPGADEQSGDRAAPATSGAPPPAGAPAGPATSQGQDDFGLNEEAARQHTFQRFSPVPDAWQPQELKQLQFAKMANNPGAVAAIQAAHDARVGGQNNLRAKAAQTEYNGLYGVYTAPEGKALDALSLVEPQEAARLKQAGVSDEQIREHAASIAGIVHSTANLPVEFKDDGQARDKNTGQVIPGYHNAIGVSPKDLAELYKTGQTLVEVPNSDGTTSKKPQWQADGSKSLTDWVQSGVALSKQGGLAPTAVAAGVQAHQATVDPKQPNAVPGQQSVKVSAVTSDPKLAAALKDPDYKVQSEPVKAGTSATPEQIEIQKGRATAVTDLKKDMQEGTTNAAQALAYAKAAKAIMTSAGAPQMGIPSQIQNAISHFTGGRVVDASNYQEVAKYLGNLALQGAKSNYGTKMSTSEVMMQKDQLAASVHMQPEAINNILDRNIRDAQYVLDTARRIRPYLATGNDPQTFAEWNEKHYSRSEAVNGPDKPKASNTAPAASLPPEAVKALTTEGKHITFRNGQTWTLQNGKPVQVK